MKKYIKYPLYILLALAAGKLLMFGIGKLAVFMLFFDYRSEWAIPACVADTANRPAGVPSSAAYEVWVSGEVVDSKPCYINWLDLDGVLELNGKRYPHIRRVLNYHVEGDSLCIDTLYYENMSIGIRKEDVEDMECRILPKVGGNAQFKYCVLTLNGNDTVQLSRTFPPSTEFHNPGIYSVNPVYGTTGFRIKCGIRQFDSYVPYHIVKDADSIAVYFPGRREEPLSYRLSENCNYNEVNNEQVCFMDKENGRIYFLKRESFIEPVDSIAYSYIKDDLRY